MTYNPISANYGHMLRATAWNSGQNIIRINAQAIINAKAITKVSLRITPKWCLGGVKLLPGPDGLVWTLLDGLFI